MALSLLNDPRAFLGTDTGGKVATLEVMVERGRLDPDIGYWAERWDPEGRVHPLYYTSHIGDRWVNATTLPMLYAGYPLYRLGGYRLALLLPMLGSVLAALAARALARRLGSPDGWAAFWIIGLASPLAIYALDFWEHSLGVAAMAWAVVFLIDVVERRRSWRLAAAAGALFGAAATLRTEALVYGFVAVAAACLVLLVRHRHPLRAFSTGALTAVGLVVPLALNLALEVATVGDPIRSQRATGTASAAVSTAGDAGASRLEEAALNAAALTPVMEPLSYLLGLALTLLLAFVALRAARPADVGPAAVAAAGAAALYAIRFADGPGFVPGLVAATPLAVVGLALGWSSPASRYVLVVGLVALPLVWATQFQGGAGPQWAGRYLLVSGVLFGVAGVVSLRRLPTWAAGTLVVTAVAVTVFGLAWTSIRTHDFAAANVALNRRPEPVLVSRVAHLAREGGAFYGERRWLTAHSDADQAYAISVLEEAGATRFALVQLARDHKDQVIEGWRATGRERVHLVAGIDLDVTSYEAR